MTAPTPRLAALLTIGAIGLVGLSACGNEAEGSSAKSTGTAASERATPAPGTLIDVRTAEEFTSGHLEGATNIDISAPDFAEKIASLDKSASYTLYCRSGRRAGQALEIMKAQGFEKVSNAGGLEEAASALGLDVVTD